ncbi:Uncharacterised protein [Vibrio cholerae]|nr:Uncharacterised protein [Vibrio cholerae]
MVLAQFTFDDFQLTQEEVQGFVNPRYRVDAVAQT